MLYARIDLLQTNYLKLENFGYIKNPDIDQLNNIYREYCRYKGFKSVMPIFDSEYLDPNTDVLGYFDDNQLVAFSLIKKFDKHNIQAVQFAWTYHKPRMRLGIKSLEHECALYKELGYRYLYLEEANEYKSKFAGFEILGPI
jgi:hypothetical protein